MSHLKSIADQFGKWPLWAKIIVPLFLLGAINAIVNPQPQATPEQKAAQAAQDAAKEAAEKAERFQKDKETTAVVIAHQAIESRLNDPDSVEWMGTFVYPNLDVCVNFSAKNGFNGRVKGFATVLDGNMTINNVKAWNKRCGDSGAVRYY